MPSNKSISSISNASSLSLIETELSYTPSHKYFTRLKEKQLIDEGLSIKGKKYSSPPKCICDRSSPLQSDNSQLLIDYEPQRAELVLYDIRQSKESNSATKLLHYATFLKALTIVISICLVVLLYIYMNEELEVLSEDIKVNAESLKRMGDKIEELITELKERTIEPMCVSDGNMLSILKDTLAEYDADKTGQPDFAMESAGGKVLSTRETRNHIFGLVKFFGFNFEIATDINAPILMLKPGNNPGECWAFRGSQGVAVIQLIDYVFVTGVTLEHIPKNLSPSKEISTAPNEFSIWGLDKTEPSTELLGLFTYRESGPPLQYFPIIKKTTPYRKIEFRVHTNHGNKYFTCVYRLRVHGDLVDRSHPNEKFLV